ncbi:hypothetical protein Tsp_03735, partial [Trichinella spiralis]
MRSRKMIIVPRTTPSRIHDDTDQIDFVSKHISVSPITNTE